MSGEPVIPMQVRVERAVKACPQCGAPYAETTARWLGPPERDPNRVTCSKRCGWHMTVGELGPFRSRSTRSTRAARRRGCSPRTRSTPYGYAEAQDATALEDLGWAAPRLRTSRRCRASERSRSRSPTTMGRARRWLGGPNSRRGAVPLASTEW